MLTPQGYAVLAAGCVSLVVGRIFGVVELFVIGAACFIAVGIGLVYVRLRRPDVLASRWIHPAVLVAGDTGRVDLHLQHRSSFTSAPFVLEESVRRTMTDEYIARLPVDALPSRAASSSGYQVPSAVRGVVSLGPLRVVVRDPLGVARSSTTIAGIDEIVVAPRIRVVDMPSLGQGTLGAALLQSAQRLGPGDFHGLREYVVGDETRSIHWRASARSDKLMVKEHTVEGLHQCTVVFDATPGAYLDDASFERGVTAAASLVDSSMRAGLTTRFVTAGGVDLRGPEVVPNTMRVLARIEPSDAPLAPLDAEVVDGLGMLVVVTGRQASSVWRLARNVADPTITKLSVTTDEPAAGHLGASARSDQDFLASWQRLVGRGRVDVSSRR